MLKTNIEIFGLRIPACIGCLPEERTKKQDITFDVIVYFDARSSCQSDQLDHTIDYMKIRNILIDACESNQFYLMEKLAWHSIEKIFAAFVTAEEIHIKIKKFEPLPEAQHVGFGLQVRRPA